MTLIDKYYNKASDLALKEVERLARQVLKDHPELDEFIMCMGSYFFTVKNSEENILPYTEKMNISWNYYSEDTFPYLKPINDFIGKWDNYLKLTGEPMRFTAKGKIVKNW